MSKVLWCWVVVDVALIGYLWWKVKQTDDKQDAADAQSQALVEEMQEYNRLRKMPLPRTMTDEYYQAFMLDGSDHPHPRTPPKAA